MKVECEASGHRDGCRPEREKGWWAAKSTSSSSTPDPALGRRELFFSFQGAGRNSTRLSTPPDSKNRVARSFALIDDGTRRKNADEGRRLSTH